MSEMYSQDESAVSCALARSFYYSGEFAQCSKRPPHEALRARTSRHSAHEQIRQAASLVTAPHTHDPAFAHTTRVSPAEPLQLRTVSVQARSVKACQASRHESRERARPPSRQVTGGTAAYSVPCPASRSRCGNARACPRCPSPLRSSEARPARVTFPGLARPASQPRIRPRRG